MLLASGNSMKGENHIHTGTPTGPATFGVKSHLAPRVISESRVIWLQSHLGVARVGLCGAVRLGSVLRSRRS
jgi:hypothetical protein